MPRLFPDRLRRAAPALLCVTALLCLPRGHAAPTLANELKVNFDSMLAVRDDGTMLLDKVLITQTQGTLIRASKAEGSELSGGYSNSHWVLTGEVHIEYDDGVLDADAATVVFANQLIQSIEVHGAPAKFSHPGKIAGQPFTGSAEAIAFDGVKRHVRLTGHSWFSYGPNEGNSEQPLVYEIDTAVLRSEKGSNPDASINMTIQREDRRDRVPTPRTPERSKAQ